MYFYLRIRHTRFLFISLLVLVLLYSCFFGDVFRGAISPAPLSTPTPARISPWSSALEANTGKWVPRDPPYTSVTHYRALNSHKSGWVWKGCKVLFDSSGSPLKEGSKLRERLEAKRLVTLMNWVWQPSRGKIVPFDPLDFVARLLKSPGGLIILGDSLTREHQITLAAYLTQYGVAHQETKENHTTRYFLRLDDPTTKLIHERAGVPESRLRRPFMTSIEDHMILSEEDIRVVANAPRDWVWPIKHHPHVENLMELLNELVKPVEGEEEQGVWRDSILLFSTGPHWSRSRLPIPQTGYQSERAAMLEIYHKVVTLLTTRFSLLPRTTMFYRSSSAPHPHCERHSKPYPSLAAAQEDDARLYQIQIEGYEKSRGEIAGGDASFEKSKEQKEREDKNRNSRMLYGRWDWDLWEVYNEMWKMEIANRKSHASAKDKGQVGKATSQWHYLDIADLSLQRPDAHAAPGEDCLHYCAPTIYEDWTRLLYHHLYLLGEIDLRTEDIFLDDLE